MENIYLFIACAFFAMQFIFQKLFEKRTKGGLSVCLWNALVCTLVTMAVLAVRSGLPTESNGYVILIAALYSASGLTCTIASITAMSRGNVASLGTFCLAGGMILPFVYGIVALNEEAGLFKWLGIIVLLLSLIPSVMSKSGQSKMDARFALYASVVFVTNGFVSIFSAMHQKSPQAIDGDGFLFIAALIRLTACIMIILAIAGFRKAKGNRGVLKSAFWEIGKEKMTGILFLILLVFAGSYAVCNTLGNIFSLRCLLTMDASLQFPILSAVVIVLTALFGRIFFGEKITRNTWISLAMSVLGIGLFMLN
ncbi:MAG: hypothetical protein IJF78_17690 [Clostridia bacterium]|nr:hypothetical protein [Clostridia bacterium]